MFPLPLTPILVLLTNVLGLGGVSYDFGDSTEISRVFIEPGGATDGGSHFI